MWIQFFISSQSPLLLLALQYHVQIIMQQHGISITIKIIAITILLWLELVSIYSCIWFCSFVILSLLVLPVV